MKQFEEKNTFHPGFAIRFKGDYWLGGGHGWHAFPNAFYATISQTKDGAELNLKEAQEDFDPEFFSTAEIVVAWEPRCVQLQFENQELKDIKSITREDMMEVDFALMDIDGALKMIRQRLKSKL